MAVYVVTGKLGGGKTLACIDRIHEALAQGRRVATNLDLELHRMPYVGRYARQVYVLRCPDKPSADDIDALGYGIAGVTSEIEARRLYDEKRFGILVLDECGTWFNSRDWAEGGRRELVNVLLHIRKKLWHVYLIIQDISMLDKQARKALAEHVVYCRRLDRLAIPFISFWVQRFTGNKMPLPQVHIAIVKYGDRPDSLTVERWFYRGGALFSSYDTTQIFRDDYPHGVFQYLPPWYVFGRAKVRWTWGAVMRLTHIVFRKYSLALLLSVGVGLGAALAWWQASKAASVRDEAFALQLAEVTESANKEASEPVVVEASGPWSVVEESSLQPDRWVAYLARDGVEFHRDDLAALGWMVERFGSCAYRLEHVSGERAVARCSRRPRQLEAGAGPAPLRPADIRAQAALSN